MSEDHFEGDNFAKWMLGITASVVVAVGGWLGVTLTTLNTRFGVVESQLMQMSRTMDKLADDSEAARREREAMKERIIRLEIEGTRINNTRVSR